LGLWAERLARRERHMRVPINLRRAKILAAVNHETQPTGCIHGERCVPAVELGPMSGVKETCLSEGIPCEQFQAREIGCWATVRDRGRSWGGLLRSRSGRQRRRWSGGRGLRWGWSWCCRGGLCRILCPRRQAQRRNNGQHSQAFPHDSSLNQ